MIRSAVQERFSSPVKDRAAEIHTAPLSRSPMTYCAFLLSGSITQAIKYHPLFTKEKGGATDSSSIREPEGL